MGCARKYRMRQRPPTTAASSPGPWEKATRCRRRTARRARPGLGLRVSGIPKDLVRSLRVTFQDPTGPPEQEAHSIPVDPRDEKDKALRKKARHARGSQKQSFTFWISPFCNACLGPQTKNKKGSTEALCGLPAKLFLESRQLQVLQEAL